MLENITLLLLGETMYGARNNQIRNFILTFIAGWIFAQVFTISPKNVPFQSNTQTTQNKR
jgi:hypothetical protein